MPRHPHKPTWLSIALLGIALFMPAGTAQAQTMTMTQNFDGLTCPVGSYPAIPNGTGGLDWSNFYCVNGPGYGLGYAVGTRSAPNGAFNGLGRPAAITRSAGVFTLNSAWLTSAFIASDTIRVEGFRNGVRVATATVTITNTAAREVTFPWFNDLDRVEFSSVSGTQIVMDDLNYTLRAHTITVTPPSNGTLSCTPNPVPDGANASCTATPATGYTVASFAGCARVGTGNTCTLTNVTGPSTVSATFALATYPITATPPANGTLSCTPDPVTHGSNSTCTATPDAGFALASFSANCTPTASPNACQLTNVTGPATVSAMFAVIAPVPTLSHWALMLLGLGAAGIGARRLRKGH